MPTKKIQEYNIEQKARNIAETDWLELPGDNKYSRRLVKLQYVRDAVNPEKFVGIHLELMYQKRKSLKDPWPSKTVDLRKVPRNLGFKFSLDSHQTKEVLSALNDAYPIGEDDISSGRRVVLRGVGENEVIVTESNKLSLLKQLSKALTHEDINDWLEENLSFISANVALSRVYKEREKAIETFEEKIKSLDDENSWKTFLKANKWIFGSAYVNILQEPRIDLHHETDLPFEVEGGFVDIVEIKKPSFPFWAQARRGGNFLYRQKFLIPHHEIQGAISQLSKYIFQAEKNVDSAEYIKDHGGNVPLKPRGLIVHGRSNGWTIEEWESFRLLNDELHNVQIITFDHLLERAKRSLETMSADGEQIDTPEEIPADDIPF